MTLALIASGHWDSTTSIPVWVKVSAATAIALGTYLGGWRIIRTLGKGLVDITPATGHVERRLHGGGHPLCQPPRVRPVDDPRGDRVPSSAAASAAGPRCGGPRPGAWSPHGRPVPIAALVGALMWWIGRHSSVARRRHPGLPHPRRALVLDVSQLAARPRRRRQRQRRLGPRGPDHLPRVRARPSGAPGRRAARPRTPRPRPGHGEPAAPPPDAAEREPAQPSETKTH